LAVWKEAKSRIEMCLVSSCDQTARISSRQLIDGVLAVENAGRIRRLGGLINYYAWAA